MHTGRRRFGNRGDKPDHVNPAACIDTVCLHHQERADPIKRSHGMRQPDLDPARLVVASVTFEANLPHAPTRRPKPFLQRWQKPLDRRFNVLLRLDRLRKGKAHPEMMTRARGVHGLGFRAERLIQPLQQGMPETTPESRPRLTRQIADPAQSQPIQLHNHVFLDTQRCNRQVGQCRPDLSGRDDACPA